jgi:DNA-binding NarL/FixJ family response regulator
MTIRTVVVDDHPAMRRGVAAILESADGIDVVGSASGGKDLWPLLGRAHPDVVVLDQRLRGEYGVMICHRIKRSRRAPAVVLYSEFADRGLVAPAMLAGADALLSKRASAAVFCHALVDVTSQPVPIPTLRPADRERLGAMLERDEVALAAQLLTRRSVSEIATSLQLPVDEVIARAERLILRITPKGW